MAGWLLTIVQETGKLLNLETAANLGILGLLIWFVFMLQRGGGFEFYFKARPKQNRSIRVRLVGNILNNGDEGDEDHQ